MKLRILVKNQLRSIPSITRKFDIVLPELKAINLKTRKSHMTETFVPSQSSTTKKWYVIDANEQILGRLASKLKILTEKNKSTYTPI